MPRLACQACGKSIYTVAPLEALFHEERRCPRCGATMGQDRREAERRDRARRAAGPDAAGPPTETGEQRVSNRRTSRRRKPVDGESRAGPDTGGWVD